MSPNDVEITPEVAQEAAGAEPTAKKKSAAKETVSRQKKSTTIDEVMTAIKNMTVLELSQLVKALESEFGVAAAAPVVAAVEVFVPAQA